MSPTPEGGAAEGPVWTLFQQLRRRRLLLGIDDYRALRTAMLGGFGLRSRAAMRELCCALWAKSEREAQVVRVLFDQMRLPDWDVRPRVDPVSSSADGIAGATATASAEVPASTGPGPGVQGPTAETARPGAAPSLEELRGLPHIAVHGLRWPDRPFVFVPQFPVSYRETAQVWRRLRRAVRYGPATDLDIPETIRARIRQGVGSAPVLVPRRRNLARLLILVDRHGSMAPFHAFVDEVTQAVARAAALQRVDVYYFRNLPVTDVDPSPLDQLAGELFPTFDAVLPAIAPAASADVAAAPDLLEFQPLESLLQDLGVNGAVTVMSDAGAARGAYRPQRLLESLSFLKMLQARTTRIAWMNPVSSERWLQTTAGQIARHWPMFPMTRAGMHDAVNLLRGHPQRVERPL